MSIEIGSKWVKDGEVVKIISRNKNNYENLFNCFVSEYCVWYSKTQEKDVIHVLTEQDFLEQYKPYEPVYEYKYVIGFTEFQKITNKFYKSDEELMSSEDTYGFIGQSFQRLDFTKRERKQ